MTHPENTGTDHSHLRDVSAARSDFEALMDRMHEAAPTAAELTERYGHTSAEDQAYGEVLRDAARGELEFDPTRNIMELAVALDAAEPTSGVGDIAVDAGPDDSADISDITMRKIAQQVHVAKALGCTVHGRPRVEGGKVKLRFIKPVPGKAPSEPPRFADDGTLDESPRPDKNGEEIPPRVLDNMRAGTYFANAGVDLGVDAYGQPKHLRAGEAVGQILHAANHGEMRLPLQMVMGGAASFYKNLAAGLGYRAEVVRSGSSYVLRLEGKRPGFERQPQAA